MIQNVTRILLILNIGTFILVNLFYYMFQGPAGIDMLFKTFGLHPANFNIFQPFTSMFLHGGMLHLFVNMLALWSIGSPIEREVGAKRFSILYLVSGIGGAILVLLLQDPKSVTIGASGAILGILGAMAILFPNNYLLVFFFPMKARTAVIIFGSISLVFALSSSGFGISHAGHLGGLIAGLIYSRLFLKKLQRTHSDNLEEEELSEMSHKEFIKEVFRDMKNNPRSSVFNSRGFIYGQDSGFSDEEQQTEKKKGKTFRLLYDPETGKFYYKS